MLERWVGGFSSWAALPLRLAVGVIFAAHGWQKFANGLDRFAGFLSNLGIPLPEVFAFLVAFFELVGGIGLIVGLFTRYWSIPLAIIMIVAIFTVKLQAGLLGSGGRSGYELDLALLAGCLALLLTGPGPLSLERAIFHKEL
ncbi:MAG: DoxX family protein [Candidatus Bipolaricaulota bacterium]|nr:DoxX family protein [Candidatus Bipolaricaulota bacterium]MCS7274751.1 DoxX family protein [Candidatus Bipolaricaulota bacterium]MDW8110031.1 DoxX family protein [Candidatus Bipolaricaulota bacterium]MDW8328897.1 DoxX family protein [Candidatus Bipolaricaulota bacterium]